MTTVCLFVSIHQKSPGLKEEDEPEEEEEDELGHAETYAEYMPMKCKYDCCVVSRTATTNISVKDFVDSDLWRSYRR